MSTTQPDAGSLDRLHDIIVPGPIPWWPPAPAWYELFWCGAILCVIALAYAAMKWQKNRYRREALALLRHHASAFKQSDDRTTQIAALSIILKRCALSAWPREKVAPLTGTAWFSFLDRTGNTNRFSAGSGHLMETAAFDPANAAPITENETTALTALARQWIKHHRVTPGGD